MTLRQTPRNLLFIRQLDRQGIPAHVIYHRCAERLVWDGPLPDVADILKIIQRSPVAGRVPAAPVGAGTTTGAATATPAQQNRSTP